MMYCLNRLHLHLHPQALPHRHLALVLWAILTLLLSACGGGGGGSSSTTGVVVSGPVIQGNNVMPVVVNSGLSGLSAVANRLYASVTVCAPLSTRCITLDNILVDTGSTGLRLISNNALSALSLTPPNGFSALQTCIHFLDNSSVWGNVKLADVQLGNMVASNIPIQLINDPDVTAPSPCTGTALTHAAAIDVTDHHALHANGILGLGMYTEDCGTACANSTNGTYYSCTSSSCSDVSVPTSAQVQNPMPHFASDNNGVVVVLPSVGASGAASVNGTLLFGIGTQNNNQLGSSTLLPVSRANSFQIHTSVTLVTPGNGANTSNLVPNMPSSFLDTGSNGLYFGTTTLPACTTTPLFYCPPRGTPVTFYTTLSGDSGSSKSVSFVAANADDQFNSPSFALPALTGVGSNSGFDWGLPFYFGRTVFQGIEGMPASTGVGNQTVTGPFYAF